MTITLGRTVTDAECAVHPGESCGWAAEVCVDNGHAVGHCWGCVRDAEQ